MLSEKSRKLLQRKFGTGVLTEMSYMPVYNIEVRGQHVYEVIDAGIFVHNAGPLCSRLQAYRNGWDDAFMDGRDANGVMRRANGQFAFDRHEAGGDGTGGVGIVSLEKTRRVGTQ